MITKTFPCFIQFWANDKLVADLAFENDTAGNGFCKQIWSAKESTDIKLYELYTTAEVVVGAQYISGYYCSFIYFYSLRGYQLYRKRLRLRVWG